MVFGKTKLPIFKLYGLDNIKEHSFEYMGVFKE
jgi:hypothetical protein